MGGDGRGELVVELSCQDTPGERDTPTIGEGEVLILKLWPGQIVVVYILFPGALHLAFPCVPLSLKRVELGLT